MSTQPRPRNEHDPPAEPAPEAARRPRESAHTPARRAAFPVLSWIGRHVRGFYAAVGTFLIALVAVLVLGGVLFAKLADGVMEGETHAFDMAIMQWMGANGSPLLTSAALEVTALGASLVVWMVVMVSSVFLWVSRHRYSVLLLWVSILGAGLVNTALKAFFDRERPDVFPWRTPQAAAESFPSGHSMTSAVAYATLAFLIARLEPAPVMRRLTFLVAGMVIVLIGVSRMYLGVHWPSDVVGGWIMGLAWAAFCGLGIEALRYFRRRNPEMAEVEQDLNAEPERRAGVRE